MTRRTCEFCGKEFESRYSTAKYCGQNCWYKAKRWRSYGLKPTDKLTCPVCGEEFTPKTPTQIYCSKKCYKKNYASVATEKYRANRKSTKKICPECGREFATSRSNKVFCSSRCCQANYRKNLPRVKKPPKPLLKKICVRCGEEFETAYTTKKYCDDCRQKVNREQKLKSYPASKAKTFAPKSEPEVVVVERQTKTCEQCGKQFILKANNQKQRFCSSQCAQKNYRETHKPIEPEVEIVFNDQHGSYIFHDKSRAVKFLSYHTQLNAAQVENLLQQKKSPIAQFTVEYGGGENG